MRGAMKRSSNVPAAFLMATAAAMMAGCSGPTEIERCVDNYGNILPDAACERGYYAGGGGYYGGGGVIVVPHYVYGGSVSGGRVSGFRSSPSSNAHVTNSTGHTITRAGFGGSRGGGSFGRGGSFGG